MISSNLIKNYKLVFDSTSLLHDTARQFFGQILPPYLISEKLKITVPMAVALELKETKKNPQNRDSLPARNIMAVLEKYWDRNLVEVRGRETDRQSSDFYELLFRTFRSRLDLCLVTQNESLARRILDLKDKTKYTTQKDIKVLFVKSSNSTNILDWLGDWESRLFRNAVAPSECFSLGTIPAVMDTTPLPVSVIPKTGDGIKSSGNQNLKLIKEVKAGGEGIVYKTNNGMACKVYKKNNITLGKLEKLKLMVARPVNYPGICWPKYMVYNKSDEFIGYAMDWAEGKTIQSTVFKGENIVQCFPRWGKGDLVAFSLTVLAMITHLHERNVIIGDINEYNILVKSDREVFFVDTDSYQIENYPCPVGTTYFTPPELQGKDYRTFLRTFEHEYFAVANLLFMILLLGKPPYARIGGGTPEENIREMDFPYPLTPTNRHKVPKGPWLSNWTELPFYLRDAFYDVFENNIRLSAHEWYLVMQRYSDDITIGRFSDDLLTKTAGRSHKKRVACGSCGRLFPEGEGYLRKANPSSVLFLCSECGQRFKRQGQPNRIKPSHSISHRQNKP